jgi:hypothetical protein
MWKKMVMGKASMWRQSLRNNGAKPIVAAANQWNTHLSDSLSDYAYRGS